MTAPLSREAIARFLMRVDAPRVVHRRHAKPTTTRPWNAVRVAAERLGRFTTSDLMRETGRSRPNCSAVLCVMASEGLARKVASEQNHAAIYRRIDGGDMSGRVRNAGARLIEAMLVGQTFTRADIPGTPSQVSEAVLRTRKCGLIQRISPRQTCAVWEVIK